ncbi:hypothetical protein Droror1_Dr00002353 [Drosera rotundifolia]
MLTSFLKHRTTRATNKQFRKISAQLLPVFSTRHQIAVGALLPQQNPSASTTKSQIFTQGVATSHSQYLAFHFTRCFVIKLRILPIYITLHDIETPKPQPNVNEIQTPKHHQSTAASSSLMLPI